MDKDQISRSRGNVEHKIQKPKLNKEDIFKNLVGCIDTSTKEIKKPKRIWKLEIKE